MFSLPSAAICVLIWFQVIKQNVPGLQDLSAGLRASIDGTQALLKDKDQVDTATKALAEEFLQLVRVDWVHLVSQPTLFA